MWCAQSKHNFTGYEFACDTVPLVEPGLGCACRSGGTPLQPSRPLWVLFLKAVLRAAGPSLSPQSGTRELWAQLPPAREKGISLPVLRQEDEQCVIQRALAFSVLSVCVVQTVPRARIYLRVFVSWTSLSGTERCQVSCPRSTFMG